MSWAIQRDDHFLSLGRVGDGLREMGVMRLCDAAMSPLGWMQFQHYNYSTRSSAKSTINTVVVALLLYQYVRSIKGHHLLPPSQYMVPEDAKARCITLLISHPPRQSAGQAAEHHHICACNCAIFPHVIGMPSPAGKFRLQISFAQW
jgi:hypothetical protein